MAGVNNDLGMLQSIVEHRKAISYTVRDIDKAVSTIDDVKVVEMRRDNTGLKAAKR